MYDMFITLELFVKRCSLGCGPLSLPFPTIKSPSSVYTHPSLVNFISRIDRRPWSGHGDLRSNGPSILKALNYWVELTTSHPSRSRQLACVSPLSRSHRFTYYSNGLLPLVATALPFPLSPLLSSPFCLSISFFRFPQQGFDISMITLAEQFILVPRFLAVYSMISTDVDYA